MECKECRHKLKLTIEEHRDIVNIKCPNCGYEKQYELDIPRHSDIQKLTEMSLCEYVKKYCSWNIFVTDCPDWKLLNRYGYEIGEIGIGWAWKDNLNEATEEELYKIIALCKMSWQDKERDYFLFKLKWSSDESDKELYKKIISSY